MKKIAFATALLALSALTLPAYGQGWSPRGNGSGSSGGGTVDSGSVVLAGDVNGAANSNQVWGIAGDGGNAFYVIPSLQVWVADAGAPGMMQLPSTTGNGQPMLVQSQGPLDSGAFSPGPNVLNTPLPTSTGAPGLTEIQSGGVNYVQCGQLSNGSNFGACWLGIITPSTTNYAFKESDAGVLSVNSTAGVNLQNGAVTVMDLDVTTANTVTLAANVSLAGAAGTGGLSLNAMTGASLFPTGNFTYAAASTMTLSMTGSNAADQITLGTATTNGKYLPTGITYSAAVATPAFAQTAPTTDTPTSAFNLVGQPPYSGALVNVRGGSPTIVLAPPATGDGGVFNTNEAVFTLERSDGGPIGGGNQLLEQCGALISSSPSTLACWGAGNNANTANSYFLRVTATTSSLSGTTSSDLEVSGTQFFLASGTTSQIGKPFAGISVPIDPATSASIPCTTGGTQTISAAQSITPGLVISSGVLTSDCIIDFGVHAATGIFWVDISNVTTTDLASHNLVFTNSSGDAGTSTVTITQTILTSQQAILKTVIGVWTHNGSIFFW